MIIQEKEHGGERIKGLWPVGYETSTGGHQQEVENVCVKLRV